MLKRDLLAELDQHIAEGEGIERSFTLRGLGASESTLPESTLRAFATSAMAAIARIAGTESEYYQSVPLTWRSKLLRAPGIHKSPIGDIVGALLALRQAVEGDLLVSLEDRLRVAIHDNLLEQAEDLLKGNYHVAAMVLIGGVLENHLRRMANSRGLSWNGKGGIAQYNDALRKADAYNQADWRLIQAVGDSRNNAAHGEAEKVKPSEVEDHLRFARRFLSEHPS